MRRERKNEFMVIHKRAIRGRDSFTYGDYRQYLVDRDDGAIQPARYSGIPATMMLFGTLGLFLPVTALMLILGGAPYESIAVGRVFVFTAVSLTLIAIGAALTFGPYRLLQATGPRCYDGRRMFYFEHPVFGDKENGRG